MEFKTVHTNKNTFQRDDLDILSRQNYTKYVTKATTSKQLPSNLDPFNAGRENKKAAAGIEPKSPAHPSSLAKHCTVGH